MHIQTYIQAYIHTYIHTYAHTSSNRISVGGFCDGFYNSISRGQATHCNTRSGYPTIAEPDDSIFDWNRCGQPYIVCSGYFSTVLVCMYMYVLYVCTVCMYRTVVTYRGLLYTVQRNGSVSPIHMTVTTYPNISIQPGYATGSFKLAYIYT